MAFGTVAPWHQGKGKKMLFGANTEGIVFGIDEDSYGRDIRTTV